MWFKPGAPAKHLYPSLCRTSFFLSLLKSVLLLQDATTRTSVHLRLLRCLRHDTFAHSSNTSSPSWHQYCSSAADVWGLARWLSSVAEISEVESGCNLSVPCFICVYIYTPILKWNGQAAQRAILGISAQHRSPIPRKQPCFWRIDTIRAQGRE